MRRKYKGRWFIGGDNKRMSAKDRQWAAQVVAVLSGVNDVLRDMRWVDPSPVEINGVTVPAELVRD